MNFHTGTPTAETAHSAPSAAYTGGEGMVLTAVMTALWRRKFWIVAPVLVALIATFVLLQYLTPLYTSEARILIEDRNYPLTSATVPTNLVDQRVLLDQEAVLSHVQLLKSRDLLRRVVGEVGVEAFEGPATPGFGAMLQRVSQFVGGSDTRPRERTEEAIDAVLDNLDVFQLEKSRVISIEFSDSDPDFAAQIANKIVDTYLTVQREAKREAAAEAASWLSEEIAKLRTRLEEAEAKVEAYRNERGLLRAQGETTLTAQELIDLNAELSRLRAQRSDAEARANIIRETINSGGDISSASEVLNSPLIQRLEEQRVVVSRRIAELSSTLLPSHPRMRELNSDLRDMRQQLRSEALKLAGGLENEARIARGREEALRSTITQIRAGAERANENSIELRALEREAAAQRQVLEAFLTRFGETSARDNPDALQAEARIVSRAVAKSEPSFPKKLPILAIVGFGMLLLMFGGQASFELMRVTAAQHSAAVPPPAPQVVAAVPSAAAPAPARLRPPPPPPTSPNLAPGRVSSLDAFVPAVVEVCDRLRTRKIASESMRVAVCTPQRQLRDDWSAANIARCLSLQGDRVAVIDANLHVSALAQQLQIDGGPGLAELLTGACAFADVLHRDAKTRVHAIGAGKTRHDPAGIIVSERLEKVLDALEGSYSYIVINAPPILLAPETRVIAGHVDAAALIPDGLPGSARMIEKAREVLLAAGLEAEEIMVAGPETTQPPQPIAARGDAEEAAEHDAA